MGTCVPYFVIEQKLISAPSSNGRYKIKRWLIVDNNQAWNILQIIMKIDPQTRLKYQLDLEICRLERIVHHNKDVFLTMSNFRYCCNVYYLHSWICWRFDPYLNYMYKNHNNGPCHTISIDNLQTIMPFFCNNKYL